MNKEEFKRCFMGMLETAVFLKRGVQRFGHSGDEAMRSFLIIPAILPLNILILYTVWNSEDKLKVNPFSELLYNYLSSLVMVTIFILLAIFFFCKIQDRMQYFTRFVSGLNWIAIMPAILYLFPILLVTLEFHTIQEMQDLAVCLSLYEYSMIGFFTAHALNIRWYSAMFLTLMMYMVQNIALTAVLYP